MKFRRRPSSEEISGFLDQGTAVTGELQFSGTLRIDGIFHGSITTNDVLVVGEHAVIHADIKVGEMEIHGRVFGNIEGRRRIELYATGKVQGDIKTPSLVISPGAQFDGRSRMAAEEEGASSSDNTENRRLATKGKDEAN